MVIFTTGFNPTMSLTKVLRVRRDAGKADSNVLVKSTEECEE